MPTYRCSTKLLNPVVALHTAQHHRLHITGLQVLMLQITPAQIGAIAACFLGPPTQSPQLHTESRHEARPSCRQPAWGWAHVTTTDELVVVSYALVWTWIDLQANTQPEVVQASVLATITLTAKPFRLHISTHSAMNIAHTETIYQTVRFTTPNLCYQRTARLNVRQDSATTSAVKRFCQEALHVMGSGLLNSCTHAD
jgi:hypothetical protein